MTKAFEAEEKSLNELMMDNAGNLAYAIPLYQRKYVWGNEENSKLWDDVKECYLNNSNHFLGSLVLMKYERDEYSEKYQADELNEKFGSENVFHVVDGQQRLTSLSLVLAALYRDLLEHDDFYRLLPDCDTQDTQDWDTLKTDMRNCLMTKIRDRQSKSGKGYIPRIIPVKSIYEVYKGIVNTGAHGKRLRIEKAFILHCKNIQELREETLPSTNPDLLGCEKDSSVAVYDFYHRMFMAIANRMKTIRIVCGAGEDAFQVFESLNGTGLRLTSSDRIKNLLMGRAASECDPMPISKVEAEWNSIEAMVSGGKGGTSDIEPFFTSYMFTITGSRVSKKDLIREFTGCYLPRFDGVKATLKDLRKAADCYGTIVHTDSDYFDNDGEAKSLSPRLKMVLSGIRKNNPSQSVVPLLSAAMKLPLGFDDPDFEAIAQSLLVLLVRHKVCQMSTNRLDTSFESYCQYMNKGDFTGAINSLRSDTKDDQAFFREFSKMTFDIQNRIDVIRARYYLQMIENYLRMQTGNDRLDPEVEYTLEHIIPQDYDVDSWFDGFPDEVAKFENEESYRMAFDENVVQSIGNMCLLRRPENSSANNAVYAVKCERYQQPDEDGKTARETFQLVNQIVANRMKVDDDFVQIVEYGETFGPDAVNRRAEALANYALKVWKV